MPFGPRNPFDEVERLLERLGREVDPGDWPVAAGPALDLVDRGDRYVLAVDLPGYERDDIELQLVGDALELAAEREAETETEGAEYVRRERRHERVSRRVTLPHAVDEEGVEARYERGVLVVDLPKRSVDEGTRIDID